MGQLLLQHILEQQVAASCDCNLLSIHGATTCQCSLFDKMADNSMVCACASVVALLVGRR